MTQSVRPTWKILAALTVAVFIVGCGGGDGAKSSDASSGDVADQIGGGDGTGADVFSCGEPNNIGVGATCSAGGGECKAFGASGANLCSCDFVQAEFCGCSRMCAGDGECGSGAKCCGLATPLGTFLACIPMGCLDMGACPTLPDGGP